jgi:hypothetical protein
MNDKENEKESRRFSRSRGIYTVLTLLLCAAIGAIVGYFFDNAIVGLGIGAAVGFILGYSLGGLVK